MSAQEQSTAASKKMDDELILAIRALLDLNVQVHTRDGSVFSGIFHTATIEKEYSIYLKNARLIKKGEVDTNVTEGVTINMLVIDSDDFTKIVVKKDGLSSEGNAENAAANDVEAVADINTSLEKTGDSISLREVDGYSDQIVDDSREGSSLPLDSSGIQVACVDERQAPVVSTSSTVVGVTTHTSFHSSAPPTEVVPSKGSEHYQSTPVCTPNYYVAPAATQHEFGVSQPVIRHSSVENSWRFPVQTVHSDVTARPHRLLWQGYVDNLYMQQQTHMQDPNMQYAYVYEQINMGYPHPQRIDVLYPDGVMITYVAVNSQVNPHQGNGRDMCYGG